MENERLTFAFCSPFFIVLFGGKRRDTILLCIYPAREHSVLPHNTKKKALHSALSTLHSDKIV